MYLILFFPFLFFTGCAIGSFLNVLIDRLPREESIMGRSHCESCKKTLGPLDLIPLFSFLFLRTRCRYCRKKLSWEYPIIEMITGVLFILVFLFVFQGRDVESLLTLNILVIQLVLLLAITSSLLVIFIIDLKEQIIPDQMQIVLLVLGIGMRVVNGMGFMGVLWMTIDGLAVMAPILLIYLVTRGRGMGFGDVKLAFVMGVLLGLKGGLIALYIGFIVGAVAGGYLLLTRKKKMKSKIAFGPFLVLGIGALLFFQASIFALIRRIYGL